LPLGTTLASPGAEGPAAPHRAASGRPRRRAPERTVLAVGLLGGVLFAFVTPPFQVPDEPAHFRSAYRIGTGEPPVWRGGVRGIEEPASLEEVMRLCLAGAPAIPLKRLPAGTLRAAARIPLAPARRVFMPLAGLAPYTAAPYLPQAAGAALGHQLGLPPLWTLYLARLCNLVASLALTWWAVRLVPICRWAFALLALTPMAMFLRGSVSADALTVAGAMLLTGAACALAFGAPGEPQPGAAAPRGAAPDGDRANGATPRGRTADREALAALLLGSVVVATAKPGYWMLNALVLLIPHRRFGRPWRWAAVVAAALAITALGALSSLWVARNYFDNFHHAPGVQPYRQAMAVAARPLRFLGLMGTDYAVHAVRYAVGFVGNFGWLDTPLPAVVLVAFALLLLALAATGGDPALAISPGQRLLLAVVLAAGLAFVSFSQYVSWTPLGAGFIDGPQGRYFLPLAPVGALLLCRRRWAWPPAGTTVPVQAVLARWRDRALAAAGAAFTLVALARLWTRYYGW
jgi:hypothetical protein